MNYWLHRISYEMNISYPPMEKGYLSIGFSDFCCKDFLEQLVKDDGNSWNYFDEYFHDMAPAVSATAPVPVSS